MPKITKIEVVHENCACNTYYPSDIIDFQLNKPHKVLYDGVFIEKYEEIILVHTKDNSDFEREAQPTSIVGFNLCYDDKSDEYFEAPWNDDNANFNSFEWSYNLYKPEFGEQFEGKINAFEMIVIASDSHTLTHNKVLELEGKLYESQMYQ